MANNWVPMPTECRLYNGCNEPCDMAVGPCACGAWHTAACWPEWVRLGRIGRDCCDWIMAAIGRVGKGGGA